MFNTSRVQLTKWKSKVALLILTLGLVSQLGQVAHAEEPPPPPSMTMLPVIESLMCYAEDDGSLTLSGIVSFDPMAFPVNVNFAGTQSADGLSTSVNSFGEFSTNFMPATGNQGTVSAQAIDDLEGISEFVFEYECH